METIKHLIKVKKKSSMVKDDRLHVTNKTINSLGSDDTSEELVESSMFEDIEMEIENTLESSKALALTEDSIQPNEAFGEDLIAEDGTLDLMPPLDQAKELRSKTRTEYDRDEASPDPTDIYLKEIGTSPLLDKEQEIYFSRLAQKGDLAARKRMIESNLRLVVKIARRYVRSGMAILDLIEEGNIGLMRAVEKFDPERGFRFSTYSAWWIQQNIERAIMCQSRTIRLPVHMVKRLNGCLRTERNLSKQQDHEPTTEEIAKAWGQNKSEVEKMMALNERVVSIDSPISDEMQKPILETLGEEDSDPMEATYQEKLRMRIKAWMSQLTPKQRAVLEHRFGLNGAEPLTLDQTGNEIGLTRERVRQLQSEALKFLQNEIEKQGSTLKSLLI